MTQRDVLLGLLFIIGMILLNNVLRNCTKVYIFTNCVEKFNQKYMDSKKQFSKNEKELKSPIQTINIFSLDIEI